MLIGLGVVLIAAATYLYVGDEWWREPSASSIRMAEYEKAKATGRARAPVVRKAPPMSPPAPAASKDFDTTWAAVREADKIKDPLRRCMAYPDPPEMHWDNITVRAACARTGFSWMSLDDIRKALDEHRARDVDRAYQTYFEQSRTAKRGLLTVAYRVFDTHSGDATRTADRWVEAAPRSAFALTARGLNSRARAIDARGTDTIGQTSDERVARMVAILAEARRDFEAALRINPRLLPAYHGLMEAERLNGSQQQVERYAEAALKIDPADDRIYLDWMAASQPRWGGSRDRMAEIARLASRHLEVNPYLRLVMGKPRSDEARSLFLENRYTEALDAYEEALHIAPSAAEFGMAADVATKAGLPEKALWYRSQAYRFGITQRDYFDRANSLFRLGKPELGNALLDEAAVTNENVDGAMREIAEAYWRANRLEDAEKAYLAALKNYPLDKDALSGLSQLYIRELHATDKAQPYVEALTTNYPRNARGWLWKSYGEKPDADVRAALMKYLELADRSDPNEQAMILLSSARIEGMKYANHGIPGVR